LGQNKVGYRKSASWVAWKCLIIQGSLVRHNGTYGSRSIWLDVLGCEQLDLFDYLILVSVFRYLGNLIILILEQNFGSLPFEKK
jgi:hypothetical protein